jgi:hypothetical protein
VHAAGGAHRRIHGGNVIVEWLEGQAPRARLLDFGVWHLHPQPAEPAEVPRTTEHALCIAPEQAKGEPGDGRSDVYALAVLLYQLLTGRPPFLGDTFAATLELHFTGGATPPSQLVNVPAAIDEALLRALERDPRRRTPSAEALLGALDPLGTTGQQQVTSKGRIRALTTGELRLDELEQQSQDAGRVEGALAPALLEAQSAARPKRRRWLYLALAVAALVFGGATLVLLLDDEPAAPAADQRPAAAPRVPALQPVMLPRRAIPARPRAPRSASAAGPLRLPQAKLLAAQQALRPPLDRLRLATPPTGQPGTLVLSSGSPHTQFFMDGRLVGDGQRRVLYRIPPGPHRLLVKVKGQPSPPRDVILQPGQKLDVAF